VRRIGQKEALALRRNIICIPARARDAPRPRRKGKKKRNPQ